MVGAEALGELEIAHLENDGYGLQDVNQSHQDQDQGHIQGEGHAADRAPQEQGAGVPHKGLGGVEVVAEEAAQSPQQGRGEDGKLRLLHGDGRHQEEDHHRHGDARGQTVDAVGEVHRVDGAHDDEDRKGDVDPDGDAEGEVGEGDPQGAGEVARPVEDVEIQGGGRQLQHEFLGGGEALVLLLLHLAEVIQKADGAEDQGEGEYQGGGPGPEDQTQDQHPQASGQDEDQAAHGGRAGFGVVPFGPHLPDGLPGLQSPEPGNDEAARDQSDREAGKDQQDGGQDLSVFHGNSSVYICA